MNQHDIARLRLHSQLVASGSETNPGEVVRRLGAVQAQDYLGSLWAVGLRARDLTEPDVERALADRTIVRTWPMRGTLHFMAAEDARWMPELLTPRVIARSASRFAQLEIADAELSRARELFAEALQGGKQLTRNELYRVLNGANISTDGQRGIHFLGRLAQEGLLCFGPRRGKQHTFVLLDEWVPESRRLQRDEALAELAQRYFVGHGPATVHDLAWWSGLTVADARAGIEMAGSHLVQHGVDGETYWMSPELQAAPDTSPTAYLLPAFDEYLVGYRDRAAVLAAADAQRVNPGSNGMLNPTIVVDGQVVGTWRRELRKDAVAVTLLPFSSLNDPARDAIASAAERYGKFLNMAVRLSHA